MRVISGKIRGKKLYSLEGDNTRPTTDRVKENIFNLITDYVFGATVLDLFAGSGALGIEALSRGAAYCDFVENSKAAAGVVDKNLGETPFNTESSVFLGDFIAFLEKTDKAYDVIFLDPPYKAGYYKKALEMIMKRSPLHGDGIVVMERDAATLPELAEGFEIIKERKYGHTSVSILKMMGENNDCSISRQL